MTSVGYCVALTVTKNVLEGTVVEIYLVIKSTKVCHICLNGPVSLAELNELICWIYIFIYLNMNVSNLCRLICSVDDSVRP